MFNEFQVHSTSLFIRKWSNTKQINPKLKNYLKLKIKKNLKMNLTTFW